MNLNYAALAFLLILTPTTRAEWSSLFNGNDLTGWHQLNGSAPFTVVDGAIVGTAISDTPNSFLVTDEIYGDFVFECEARVEGGINSGIQFRSESYPEYRNGRVHGYQMEIDPDTRRRWTGGIYDEARRGWLYPLELNPEAKPAYLPGEWTHYRIECIGTSIRTWINGIPAAHLIDGLTLEGFIGLQVHSIRSRSPNGMRIHWRNLRIRTDVTAPTPPEGFFIRNTDPNGLDPAEDALGWRLLWDGQTSEGWRGAASDVFPDDAWKIDDGELVVLGNNTDDLSSRERFTAFELQLEFYLPEGANSGIKYFATEHEGSHNHATGLEYQLLDDANHADGLAGVAGNRTLASLYDLIPSWKEVSNRSVPRKAENWSHARIVVHPDRQVEHWLNGFQVVAYQKDSPLYQALVARSKYADIEGFAEVPDTAINLQDHGDEVRFRSIKIRELD